LSSLVDMLTEAAQEKRRRCKAADLIDSLTVEERNALDLALDRGVSSKRLAKILTTGGHPIGGTVLTEHASGRCCCEPD